MDKLSFEKWAELKGIELKGLKGKEWVNARKHYNLYAIKANKVTDKIVQK